MEPIPVNVTIPAGAGLAPFTSMAHLWRSDMKPSMKRFGKILAIGWLLSPIGLAILTIATWDELSKTSVALTTVFVMPFVVGTSYFAYRVILSVAKTPKWFRVLVYLPPLATATYFAVRNLTSYRVFLAPGEHDSPFDKLWYFWPQTSYGYPHPVIRFLDTPLGSYGSKIVDISSGLLNVWILFGVLFWSSPWRRS